MTHIESKWSADLSRDEPGASARLLAEAVRGGDVPPDEIKSLLRHSSERVRSATAWALYEASNRTAEYIPLILAGIHDSSGVVRHWCVLALGTAPPERQIEVLARAFSAYKDVDPAVRRAIVHVSRQFGRVPFEGALHVNLDAFDIPQQQMASIIPIRKAILKGYVARSLDVSAGTSYDDLSLNQVGHSLQLLFSLREHTALINVDWASVPYDVINAWIDEVSSLTAGGITSLRSLASFPDNDCQYRSWLSLDSLMVDVERWYSTARGSLSGDHPKVREAAVASMVRGVPDSAKAACIKFAQRLSDTPDCFAALRVFYQFVVDAEFIVCLPDEILRRCEEAAGDSTIVPRVRTILSDILAAYSRIAEATQRHRGKEEANQKGEEADEDQDDP